MFNKILKGAAICSVLSLSLIWGWKSVQASTNDVKTDNTDNNFTVNGEVLTEDEYWAKIEALGVEVTDSAQRDKFIPEDEACAGMNAEEFYNYISDLAAEPNEIYVLGLTEVSEEEFNKALNEDIGDYSTMEEDKFDYETVSSKSKVLAGVCQDVKKNLKSGNLADNSTHIKCQNKNFIFEETAVEPILDGIVVEKDDNFFMIDTKEGLLSGGYPTNFVVSDINTGDNIKVYYTGIILETYPGQIHTVTKIERIN